VSFSDEAILARCDPDRRMAVSASGAFMGVDVGAKFDVVIGEWSEGRPRTLAMVRVDTWAELDQLMERYGVVKCCIDSAPEEHATRDWAEKYNRRSGLNLDAGGTYGSKHGPSIRVWRVQYATLKLPSGPETVWNEKTGMVSAPRTETLSRSADELLTKRVLPRYEPGNPDWVAYLTHHRNSKRMPVFVEGLEKEGVVDHWEWHEVGPDHMFHAGTYEMLAREAPRGMATPGTGLVSFKQTRDLRPVAPTPSIRRVVRG
jgi:hypothetical protein